jgi:hypothetical protein
LNSTDKPRYSGRSTSAPGDVWRGCVGHR